MDRLATVVALALLALSGSAAAGYAQLSPPSGWSPGTGASTTYGTIPARAAANGASYWSGSTVINAGGRSVTIPVAGRFAANAGRFAARSLAFNPLALGVAGAAWLASECIGRKDGSWVLTCGGDPEIKPLDGYAYRMNSWTDSPQAYFDSYDQACASAVAWLNANAVNASIKSYSLYSCSPEEVRVNRETVNGVQTNYARDSLLRKTGTCPAGWFATPGGCVQTPPPKTITPEEVVERMAPKTIPPEVFPEIPNVPLPIDVPSINPTPSPNGPASPLIVPQGDPVKVPNSNPTRWTQPEIQITPAPSPDSPFRVDIKPQDRPVGDPLTNPPRRDPWTPPVTPPVTDPNNPPVGDPDPSKDPVEKTPDLCEKYPDILACQKMKLGELEPEKIKNTEVPLKIEKESGFPSGGQCPAPKVVALMGKSFSFTIEPLCDFAKAIKPLLLGFAYLTAALTFLGVARRE